jgi:Holliday junction resolvase RusA-like endonuclease
MYSEQFEPLVEIHLPREPVSAQSAGKKRRALASHLRALTRRVPWVYTGDVSVEIEWTVHLRSRYESDRAVDVDNIVKPILDGITGPEGCLIDDTQVNHVSVNWTTWTRTDRQHLKIAIRSLDADLYALRGFSLVEVRPRLCVPMPSADAGARRLLMDAVESQVRTYEELLSIGASWDDARLILGIQRPFHRNKLTAFEVISPEQYRSGELAPGSA